jgi:hypothetical protein
LKVDVDNQIYMRKTDQANEIGYQYKPGGDNLFMAKGSMSTTDWFHMAITWSKVANEVKYYYNGVQEGATWQGFAAWAGGALDNDECVVGAFNTVPVNVHDGFLAYPMLWSTPLTAAELLKVATPQ